MSVLRLSIIALIGLAVTGCASFQARPIVPREVLQDLQRVRLEALRPVEGQTPSPEPHPAFDLTDGVSADEAVAVALFLNPDIRAFRKERGVAEGELIAARLLPNPELQVTWLHIENFTKSLATSGWDVGLSWAPPRPGERAAKAARAQARIEEVRAQIADEEWRLAADVRKAHATLLAARERARLAEVALDLQSRVRKFLRDKRDLGDASRLEVNLLELEYVERLREREAIRNEQQKARLEFSRLLGIPPLAEVPLQGSDDVLTYRPFTLTPVALEAVMIERRPDVAAAREDYEKGQQELRLAYIQRIPWFRFGPAYERDGAKGEGSVNKLGLGFAFEIPLSNVNQGEITRLEAAREKLRELFVAKVHLARAEVNEAYRNLQGQERLVRLFQDIISPALEESEQLTNAAVAVGDVNVLQFVTAQDKVLRSRRDFLDAQLDYWKAVFDLERALGTRLSEVEGREE
jgi:cobalt-zinc-cadmium efflux system outer membrane protein